MEDPNWIPRAVFWADYLWRCDKLNCRTEWLVGSTRRVEGKLPLASPCNWRCWSEGDPGRHTMNHKAFWKALQDDPGGCWMCLLQWLVVAGLTIDSFQRRLFFPEKTLYVGKTNMTWLGGRTLPRLGSEFLIILGIPQNLYTDMEIWISMNINEYQWIPVNINEYQWISMIHIIYVYTYIIFIRPFHSFPKMTVVQGVRRWHVTEGYVWSGFDHNPIVNPLRPWFPWVRQEIPWLGESLESQKMSYSQN